MTWWRSLSVLLCILTALVSPRSASATSGVGPETRVKEFFVVATALVGGSSARSLEKHVEKSAAYDENASGSFLAAEGVEATASTLARTAEDIPATFIGQEAGPSIVVPSGATGPTPALNGAGVRYLGGAGGPGLDARVSGLRIMDPTARYPGGYASYSNAAGQAVSPLTGQTIAPANPWWHIVLPW